jgi:hypothetical protein
MLSLDDKRWLQMSGGYGMPFDPRALLTKLGSKTETAETWHELWEELHHQGDVGVASYASVPYLVDICQRSSEIDWNPYAIVATIELARTEAKNPPPPNFLQEDYFRSLHELARIGAEQILIANDLETFRAILSVIALAKGARAHARFLINYSEDELLDLENRAFGGTSSPLHSSCSQAGLLSEHSF